MTFDEWFEKEFAPSFAYSNDDPYRYESAARSAWEAAWGASREQFIEDCEIVADSAADAGSYSLTPMRLRFFTMGTKTVIRDLKSRLRV